MILIGITGKAGSGKDTVGNILHERHNFACVAFASPIKAMICQLLNVPRKIWDDRVWREMDLPIFGCSPRVLAQTIGTEWGRLTISDDLWLDLALEQVKSKKNQPRWAITDVRFENEATKIRELGGHILHVERVVSSVGSVGHASEGGIKVQDQDSVMHNYTGLPELYSQVNEYISYIADVEQTKEDRAQIKRNEEDAARVKNLKAEAAKRKRSRR